MPTLSHRITTVYRCGSLYRTAHSVDGLPGFYHGYLSLIHHRPGLSQDEIAKYLCWSKSSATRHLAFLEEQGYIERRKHDADKRATLVYPTEKLEAVIPEISRISADWQRDLTRGIDDADYAVFLDVLQKLSDRARSIVYGGDAE